MVEATTVPAEPRSLSSREHVFEMMNAVLTATSSFRGEEFLRRLVQSVATELDVAYAYIAECVDNGPSTVRTTALWTATEYGKNFEYKLDQTPCENVIRGGQFCCYVEDLQRLFPEDKILEALNVESYVGIPMTDRSGTVFGHFVVMDTKPFQRDVGVKLFLRNCAFMAEVEIERFRWQTRVLEKETELARMADFVTNLNSHIGLVELLQEILQKTLVLSGSSKATAILLEPSSRMYRLAASTDSSVDERNISLTDTEIEARYFTGTEEVSPGLFIVRDVVGRAAEEKLQGIALPFSLLVLRIVVKDSTIGALVFDNTDPEYTFSDETVQTLAVLHPAITAAVIKARMLDELSRLNSQKNEFLGMVAHDLRNPLQAIGGYVAMMLDALESGQRTEDSFRKDLIAVQQGVDRMQEITCKLLNLASIESGKIPLNLGVCNYAELLEEAIAEHSESAMRKNIRLHLAPMTDQPVFPMDGCAIHEVLDNLISNAVKYTRPGGQVIITCTSSPGEVRTVIADTGLGLTEDDLRQMFSGFRKLSARPTAGESSTGLGLVIVKKIVERHGGRMEVSSSPGVGSSFSFSLPTSLTVADTN